LSFEYSLVAKEIFAAGLRSEILERVSRIEMVHTDVSVPLGPVKRCRLLYLVGQLSFGGLERQLCYLLAAMDRPRYRPAVVVWNYNVNDPHVASIRALGVPLYPLPDKLSSRAKLRELRTLVRSIAPEVLHSYSFYTNFAAWYGAFASRAISIGSIRQDFITERRLAGAVVGRLSARWPRSQICNSLAAKHNAEQSRWFSRPDRMHVARNGLDIGRYTFRALQPNRPSLLAIGRLEPEKRWDRLLSSVSLLVSKGLKFSVDLVGEGPLRMELESQAKRLGISSFVQFLGLQNDIPTLLGNCTFLVHTAEAEGCPNVVMEAMACGRAVVATDAGDVPSLVEHGKTGFVVPRGNERALVQSMETLIRDHHLCCQMGLAGRAKAEQQFGLDHLISETLAAYRAAGWKDH
jgi:glycosyltransferase involved in cell wall biosynthesis